MNEARARPKLLFAPIAIGPIVILSAIGLLLPDWNTIARRWQAHRLTQEIQAGKLDSEWLDRPRRMDDLIALGSPAGESLLQMLSDLRTTGITYSGDILEFGPSYVVAGEPIEREATFADLANFALQHIYGCDVG